MSKSCSNILDWPSRSAYWRAKLTSVVLPCCQVISGDLGQTLPFYFPFQPSYWRSHHDSCSPGQDTLPNGSEHATESTQSGERAAVAIDNMHKVFPTTDGKGKRALDGWSLDVYHGQITALLGEADRVCACMRSCLRVQVLTSYFTAKCC